MEQEKHRPWRRWVVLVLMIAGFILAGYFVPVRPEITVAAEKLIEKPLITLPAPFGPFYLVNTLPTLVFTILLLIVIAFFTNRSLKKSQQTDLVPRGIGNLMEAFLELLYNLTEGSAGAKWAKTIFPWFATIMIYVLFANLLKLIPGFESIGVLHPAESGGYATQSLGNFLGGSWNLLLPTAQATGGYILVPFVRGISLDLNFTFASGDHFSGYDPGGWLSGTRDWLFEQVLQCSNDVQDPVFWCDGFPGWLTRADSLKS